MTAQLTEKRMQRNKITLRERKQQRQQHQHQRKYENRSDNASDNDERHIQVIIQQPHW